jgi:ech hydrogenase subunit D
MVEKQEIIVIKANDLLEKVSALEAGGYRLVQICCTRTDKLTVDYTFDDATEKYKFIDYRIELPLENAELPSISGIYLAAFVYENELHDLFGIKIDGIAIDFGGKFYRIDAKQPFNDPKIAEGEV